MDAQELKQIMEENCEQLASLLSDYKNQQPEMILLAKVMGPILQEYQQLQEQTFRHSDREQEQ